MNESFELSALEPFSIFIEYFTLDLSPRRGITDLISDRLDWRSIGYETLNSVIR